MTDFLERAEIEEVQEALGRAAIILLELGPKLDAFNEMAELGSSAGFVVATGSLDKSAAFAHWLPIGRAGAGLRDVMAPGYEEAVERRKRRDKSAD